MDSQSEHSRLVHEILFLVGFRKVEHVWIEAFGDGLAIQTIRICVLAVVGDRMLHDYGSIKSAHTYKTGSG